MRNAAPRRKGEGRRGRPTLRFRAVEFFYKFVYKQITRRRIERRTRGLRRRVRNDGGHREPERNGRLRLPFL